MSDDRSGEQQESSQNQSWLDRHLGKLVVAVLILCVAGLVVRALVA